MEYRTLGNDLTVSAVGLGCMGMSHAYGAPANKKEMTELLAQAVGMGYTFFDTAEVYGTPDNPHDNEELVGAALKPYRDKIVLATKFGIHFDMTSTAVNKPLVPDSRPEVIRASVDASLKRLGTDHIDLYYQHRLDPKVPIGEVAGVMADLIREGKITHWGLSEATEETIRRAHAVCPVTAIQNRYSMMARWYESLFPVLEELHIGYVAFSPLANGFLSGKYDKTSKFEAGTDYRSVMPQFQPDSIDQNHALLELLHRLAAEKNAPPAQISLAWICNNFLHHAVHVAGLAGRRIIPLFCRVGSGNRFSSRRVAILALPYGFKPFVDDCFRYGHDDFCLLAVAVAGICNGVCDCYCRHINLIRTVSHCFHAERSFVLHLHDQFCNVLAHNTTSFQDGAFPSTSPVPVASYEYSFSSMSCTLSSSSHLLMMPNRYCLRI